MEYFIKAFEEFGNFNDRATRKEYWMFILFYIFIYIGLGLVDSLLGMSLLTSIFSLVLFIPSLSFAARRLHDTGRSGWWQLLVLLPLIGAIVLLVFLVLDSEPGDNEYGPATKYPAGV